MLVSFLESLFDEIIGWLIYAYQHQDKCLDFTLKIKPYIQWEYGHLTSKDGNWKNKFKAIFQPTARERTQVLHRLSLVLEFDSMDVFKNIFDDLVEKRHTVAHGNIFSDLDKQKKEFNLNDLKLQEERVKIIMTDLFKACDALLNPKTPNEERLYLIDTEEELEG